MITPAALLAGFLGIIFRCISCNNMHTSEQPYYILNATGLYTSGMLNTIAEDKTALHKQILLQ
jgi:hypothetical protein